LKFDEKSSLTDGLYYDLMMILGRNLLLGPPYKSARMYIHAWRSERRRSTGRGEWRERGARFSRRVRGQDTVRRRAGKAASSRRRRRCILPTSRTADVFQTTLCQQALLPCQTFIRLGCLSLFTL